MSTYMGLNSQVELSGFSDIANSDGFIFELQFHTRGSYDRKNGPGHFLYERFRDPAITNGTIGGRTFEGDRYRQVLYILMALLWNRRDKLGHLFQPGDIVNSAIPNVDYQHKVINDEPYRYQRFLPTTSLTGYSGLFPDLDREPHERRTVWICKAQSSKKYSHVLDGLIEQREEQLRRRRQGRLMQHLTRMGVDDRSLEHVGKRGKTEKIRLNLSYNDDGDGHGHVVHHHRHESFGEGLICPGTSVSFSYRTHI